MAGKSLFVNTVAHPERSRELSHKKNPRLTGPLVLSFEGGLILLSRMSLFSTLSRIRIETLKAKDVDSSEAYAPLTEISHSVRNRAPSQTKDMNR